MRLRSIGDTVLTTPSLIALRRFLPDAQIDILLEDWVAPVLKGFDAVDSVLTVSKDSKSRLKTAQKLRKTKYDVAFNQHGGTTATFFVRASGAKHRVGYKNYQYSFLYNHLLSSASDFWKKEFTNSAEQQLALLGFVGVPVEDKPKTQLAVTEKALKSLKEKLTAETQRRKDLKNFRFQIPDFKFQNAEKKTNTPTVMPGEITQAIRNQSIGKDQGESAIRNLQSAIALLHPTAAFDTKQWATENFARVAEFLKEKGLQTIAVATKKEREVLEDLQKLSSAPILTFDDLNLPEITALASCSKIFVGNDSGIAHIAAAVQTPSVVIFGSSNRNHWRPWTDAPNEIVYEEFPCQPCPGYVCEEFGEPKCILSVKTESVIEAIERVLAKS